MRFGLFCSAQANARELGLEIGQGFRDYLDFNVEAEALGFHSSFLVEHHFTGWNQVSDHAHAAYLSRDENHYLAAGHRRNGLAVAQPGLVGRASGDA